MRFLHRAAGLTLHDRVRSSAVLEDLRAQAQFQHLIRMPSGHFCLGVPGMSNWRRRWGWPRTCWGDYIPWLGLGSAWDLPRGAGGRVSRDREAWATLLALLPPQTWRKTALKIDGRKFFFCVQQLYTYTKIVCLLVTCWLSCNTLLCISPLILFLPPTVNSFILFYCFLTAWSTKSPS